MPINKLVILFFLLIFYSKISFAQRYHFEQLNIEDGLAQSQVTTISQDSKRRLWIGTLGGISVYNGMTFTTYTKIDGLNSNFTLCLSTGQNNNVWIGTARGVSRYDGQIFHNYKNAGSWSSKIVTDRQGETHAIIHRQLHKMNQTGTSIIQLTKNRDEKVTALNIDARGQLWAAVYGNGIYQRKGEEWENYTKDIKPGCVVVSILNDRFVEDKLWLLTEDGLYISQSGKTSKTSFAITGKLMSIAQDQDRNIWIGTNNGAYRIASNNTLIHFNKANGLTDNQVNEIFIDVEDNIWFGTDGSGIFKYNKLSYETIDESQGLRNNIVMSLITGDQPEEIWLGTYNGLFSYQNGKLKEIHIPSNSHASKKINVLFKDHKGFIWIGTPGGGLWVYDGKRVRKIDKDNNLAYNAIMEDSQNRIWVSTNAGNLLLDQQQKKFIKITELFSSSMLELSKDSVIIGTQEGIYLIDKLKYVKLMKIKELTESSVLSMIKYKHFVFFGTADNGLIIWNRATGKTIALTTRNGLAADHIYSLLADDDGIIWIGTGKGINRLDSKTLQILKFGQLNLMVECNQNAILRKGNKIWIGTTKGAVVYRKKLQKINVKKPYIFLNKIQAFSKEKMQSAQQISNISYSEQKGAQVVIFPFTKNNLNISFTSVYLTNPKSVSYQYRLRGLESKYSQPGSNTSVNYTALPAGKYTFEVKARTEAGIESANIASFSFEIIPPYYQTNLFRIAFILLIVSVILLTVYIIIQLNERKRKLRLRIKLEEQFKIRKQTAEDFHDDLGNKLTRISVLSDVLLSMIDKEDKAKRNIIDKINNNVRQLYTGTKDILWALNPKNDNLSDLINHIRDFGKELFNDTDIKFDYQIDRNIKSTRVSLPISRNILMIFKEALHNCLKHSKAKHVNFSATATDELLEIKVQDDGSGFDLTHEQSGHGINNMNVRAKRIDAHFITNSSSSGTTVNLYIKLTTLNNFRNI